MAQGLHVFDAEGRTTIDISDRLQKILGIISINQATGTIENDELRNGSLWYFFISADDINFGKSSEALSYPTVTKEGNLLKWNFNNKVLNCKLIYGIY